MNSILSDTELDGIAGGLTFSLFGYEITIQRSCTLDNNNKGQLVNTCTTTVIIDPNPPKPK